ncbi:MAG: M15 family metallopeptidase [Verrucomicrobiota bacterium]
MNTLLPRFEEETNLIEFDEDKRVFKLHPDALEAWKSMKRAARIEGVGLLLISAFRSIKRQEEIIARKRKGGLTEEEIYRYSAPPGHSEHHSGRALDLGTNGYPPLKEDFENSDAFQWLDSNAPKFGFTLSYPRNNQFGISYEPWHWLHRGSR